MNVNQKGVRGLLKVMDDLQEKGYFTFPAFDDHSPVDLVAIDSFGKCYRLQIKYREKNTKKKKNRYDFATSSVVNGKRIEIDRSMIDGWAVFLSEDNKVVYLNKKDVESKKYITIDPTKEYGQMAEWFNAPIY